MIIVTASMRRLFGQEIDVTADSYTSHIFGSLLGDRRFYLHHRQALTLKMKTKHLRRGDELTMEQLVIGARDWTKIPWVWDTSEWV